MFLCVAPWVASAVFPSGGNKLAASPCVKQIKPGGVPVAPFEYSTPTIVRNRPQVAVWKTVPAILPGNRTDSRDLGRQRTAKKNNLACIDTWQNMGNGLRIGDPRLLVTSGFFVD